jgi:SGNH hydrolase-like domain, acetyltransferase AlgX
LFFILCVMPLAFFTIDGPSVGSDEIRFQPRSPFPNKITPGVFRAVGRWFADRIGLRMTLVAAGAALHVGLLQRSTSPQVVFGGDGWLFFDDDRNRPFADFYGEVRFTDAQVKALGRELLTMREALHDCGVHGLVVVAPNKQSIYGERLLPRARPRTRLDDLLARLDPRARSVLVDLRGPLLTVKATDPDRLLYFKADTHWNDLGAFVAYHAIIHRLARSMPVGNLALASLDDFTAEVTPYAGDIAMNMLSSPGLFLETSIELKRKRENVSDGGSALGGQLFLTGDSFSVRLAPYFAPHFSKFEYRPNASPVHRLRADGPQPSAIVIEIVERSLPRMVDWNYDWKKVCPR